LLGEDLEERGQEECQRLSATCGGDAHDVSALERDRPRVCLDWGRVCKASFYELGLHGRWERNLCKGCNFPNRNLIAVGIRYFHLFLFLMGESIIFAVAGRRLLLLRRRRRCRLGHWRWRGSSILHLR